MAIRDLKILQLKAPVADCFAGVVQTDPVNLRLYNDPAFVLGLGANAGTARIKVEAFVVDASAQNIWAQSAAIPVSARQGSPSAPDTEGVLTNWSSGVELSAVAGNTADTQWVIYTKSADAGAAARAGGFTPEGIAIKVTELVDATLTGGIWAIAEPKYDKAVQFGMYLSGTSTV